MSSYIDNLIFDRTPADLTGLTSKAYIDFEDLNRIEMAIKWVSNVLNRCGYKNKVNVKIWFPEDKRTDKEMERIRDNINTLKSSYYAPSNTPLIPNKITYTSIYQANAIEQIIHDIGALAESISPGLNHLSFKLGTKNIGNRSISL